MKAMISVKTLLRTATISLATVLIFMSMSLFSAMIPSCTKGSDLHSTEQNQTVTLPADSTLAVDTASAVTLSTAATSPADVTATDD